MATPDELEFTVTQEDWDQARAEYPSEAAAGGSGLPYRCVLWRAVHRVFPQYEGAYVTSSEVVAGPNNPFEYSFLSWQLDQAGRVMVFAFDHFEDPPVALPVTIKATRG